MPNIAINSDITATQTLAVHDNLVVTTNGSLVTFADAIIAEGSNSIVVAGDVIAGSWGNPIEVRGAGVEITIASSGKVIGFDNYEAIRADGSGFGFVVRNAGLIEGDLQPAITGGTVNDTIVNSGIINGRIVLLEGNDFFDGRGGRAADVRGGLGNDTFMIDAVQDAVLETFHGEEGIDTLDLSGATAAFWVDLEWAGAKVWTSGQSIATGANANTTIANLASIENIVGSVGSDMVFGSAGANTYAYNGHSGTIVDYFDGRAGTDAIDFANYGSAVWVDLAYTSVEAWTSGTTYANGSNANTAIVSLDRVENIIDTAHLDMLFGNAADNTYVFTSRGDIGTDFFDGRGGTDTIDLSRADFSLWADLAYAGVELWTSFGDASTGANANSVLANVASVENIVGTRFTDTIFGNGLDNRLDGFGTTVTGDEIVNGRGGDDTFVFRRDYNDLTIDGFVAGGTDDQIELSGLASTYDTFLEVFAASSQVGADTVISFGSGDSITLLNVVRTNLIADDFLFA